MIRKMYENDRAMFEKMKMKENDRFLSVNRLEQGTIRLKKQS